jgi:hypothetical protein
MSRLFFCIPEERFGRRKRRAEEFESERLSTESLDQRPETAPFHLGLILAQTSLVLAVIL